MRALKTQENLCCGCRKIYEKNLSRDTLVDVATWHSATVHVFKFTIVNHSCCLLTFNRTSLYLSARSWFRKDFCRWVWEWLCRDSKQRQISPLASSLTPPSYIRRLACLISDEMYVVTWNLKKSENLKTELYLCNTDRIRRRHRSSYLSEI